jgi:hypothetical protein
VTSCIGRVTAQRDGAEWLTFGGAFPLGANRPGAKEPITLKTILVAEGKQIHREPR